MNNLENNLSKIKIKELTEEDKDSLWHSIMVGRVDEENNKSRLIGFNIFNYSMNKIIVGFVALVLILGGSGVVAASNNAVPGSFLFPVELALENIQLKLSGDDKKEELRLRFTEERLEEIRHVSEKRSASNFSKDESDDVSQALSDIEKFLADNDDDQNKEELRKSLAAILVLLGDDGKMEIRREDGRIKIETKDGEVKIEMKSGDDDSGKGSDDNSSDDSNDDDSNDDNGSDDSDDSVSGNDVKEDDSEVFCRGEWRDAEDCDDDSNSSGSDDDSDDDDSNDDNSGSGSSDDDDSDSDDSNDDDSDSGKDDDKDDDNSGSGGGDDN